jgi:hypothetical protein
MSSSPLRLDTEERGSQMLRSARKQIKYVVSSFAAVVFAVNC